MHSFKAGDLAVTVNSRVPLLNDGHIVRVVAVTGPDPEHGIEFGYLVERLDGRPFVLMLRRPSPIPVAGTASLIADWWHLRPLAGSDRKDATEASVQVPSASVAG